MATVEECRQALEALGARIAANGGAGGLDRTLSVDVTDLGTTFWGHLREGRLDGLTTEPQPKAQIRLTSSSDDLVALTDGRLHLASAWASGRVEVKASITDLVRLRSMF